MRRFTTASAVEVVLHLFVWGGWILLIHSGTENGIGYFHQPEHDLLAPLVHGALFNAVLFFGNAFWLIPHYLAKRRRRRYLGWLVALAAVSITLKSLGELGMIALWMPSLAKLTFLELVRENLYSAFAMIALSALYRFAKDWQGGTRAASQGPTPEESPSGTPHLLLKSGNALHRVPLHDVLYVQAAGNYVAFVLPERRLLSLMSMNEALASLPRDQFARIHRSYIVGLDHVDRIEGSGVWVGGARLPIGATYNRRFKEGLTGAAS